MEVLEKVRELSIFVTLSIMSGNKTVFPPLKMYLIRIGQGNSCPFPLPAKYLILPRLRMF